MRFAAKGIINTYVNRGRGGTFFVAVKNGTGDLNVDEKLKSLGYRFFRGSYTKQIIPDNVESTRQEIDQIGKESGFPVDMTGIDRIAEEIKAIKSTPATSEGSQGSEATGQIESFREKLQKEMATTANSEQAKAMMDLIDRQLENLATSTDEAAKQQFVRDFVRFISVFWDYSLSNQFLIYWQTGGKAVKVRGAKQWEKMGRTTTPEAKAIYILAPMGQSNNKITNSGLQYLARLTETYARQNPSGNDLTNTENLKVFLGTIKKHLKYPSAWYYFWNLVAKQEKFKTVNEVTNHLKGKAISGEGDMSKGGKLFFKGVAVYDYSDTVPIEGYEGEVFTMPSNDVWQSKNEDDDYATKLVHVAMQYAASLGIDISDEDTGEAGGLSRGESISVNYSSKGQRRLATLIHELAHSMLHFGDDRGKVNHKAREIDAEATAYIVMTHFGFEPANYAANYLALTGATSQEIRQRRESIAKAVRTIITGMQKFLAEKTQQTTASGNSWYKKAQKVSGFDFYSIFLPVRKINFLENK